jgi:hypothetical protein
MTSVKESFFIGMVEPLAADSKTYVGRDLREFTDYTYLKIHRIVTDYTSTVPAGRYLSFTLVRPSQTMAIGQLDFLEQSSDFNADCLCRIIGINYIQYVNH